LHHDLTPRPAFVAAAAVGRLLADAVPVGRVKTADQLIHGYVFHAKPDGEEADVLVIWSDSDDTFELRKEPLACFDHLGRAKNASRSVHLTTAPTYLILANDALPDLFPPPAPAKLLTGSPVPVVIQALPASKDVSMKDSAYRLPKGREATIPLFVKMAPDT